MSEACPSCGTAVIEAAAYCGECGHALQSPASPALPQVECPDCGWPNTSIDPFCSECGFPLIEGAATPRAAIEGRVQAAELSQLLDPATGNLVLPTVGGQEHAMSTSVFEQIGLHAPLVAQRILESSHREWGWPAEKLAEIAPTAVMLEAVKCYHGPGHKGWLVATLDTLWWLEKGLFQSVEQSMDYAWEIKVQKVSRLSTAGAVGIKSRGGILSIGGPQFQMHRADIDHFGPLLHQMQGALGCVEETMSSIGSASAEAATVRPDSPAVRLKELAELRDLGILSDDEFQLKKAELLAKEW